MENMSENDDHSVYLHENVGIWSAANFIVGGMVWFLQNVIERELLDSILLARLFSNDTLHHFVTFCHIFEILLLKFKSITVDFCIFSFLLPDLCLNLMEFFSNIFDFFCVEWELIEIYVICIISKIRAEKSKIYL